MTDPDQLLDRQPRTLRRRLEVQGFLGMSDTELMSVGRWMRFTPSCNLAVTLLATATGRVWWLVGLAPFDLLYNTLIRPLTGTNRLPRSGVRRKITFVVGALWLGATAASFASGHPGAGYAFGFLMAALILPLATVQVCVLSESMARIFGPPRPTA